MRELTFEEAREVDGGWWQVVAAVVGAVVGAVVSNSMEGSGPSATLANGTTIQCEPGQNLEVSGDSASCT